MHFTDDGAIFVASDKIDLMDGPPVQRITTDQASSSPTQQLTP
jgi:hypothetical protein